PRLQLEATPFAVADTLRPWVSPGGGPLRAGVSSFGIGGTNAHVVMEAAPVAPPDAVPPKAELIAWSAVDADAERALRQRLAHHLAVADPGGFADLAYTLQVGRTPHGPRAPRLSRDPA